ncbi:MAG: hypothetical protein H6702_14640 [Myxococcales bacterium]|nr:hypothetical protein [Myxococcales bacterium]
MHLMLACLWFLAAPPVDWAAVGRRDGLIRAGDPALFGSGGRQIVAVRPADLDGAPPGEHLVHVQEYVGEGAWTDELHVYRGGHRVGAPWIWGGYRDPGWWRVEDFDGDGRDEVLVVGDTAGDSVSETALLEWAGRAFEDRMWSLDPGVAVVPLPPEVAGEWVLLGLEGLGGPPGPAGRCVALRAGWWRPAPCPVLGDGTALVAVALEAGLPRADLAVPGLVRWLREQGAWPAPDALLPAVLDAAEGQPAYRQAALLALLGWPDGPATAEVMRAWWAAPLAGSVRHAVAQALAAAGTRGDREQVLEWATKVAGPAAEGAPVDRALLSQAFADAGETWRLAQWTPLPPGTDVAALFPRRAPPPTDPAAITTPAALQAALRAGLDPQIAVRRARALAAKAADQAPWLRAVAGVAHADAQAWREALLVSGSPAERAAAASGWPEGGPVEPLIRALAGERADESRQALADALGQAGGAAPAQVHPALLASIAEGSSLQTLRALYTALIRTRAPRAALVSVLRAGDCSVRPTLVELLARERSPEAGPAVADLRTRCPQDFERTLLAVLGEAAAGDGAAWAASLATAHAAHPDRAVRRLAAAVLGQRPE